MNPPANCCDVLAGREAQLELEDAFQGRWLGRAGWIQGNVAAADRAECRTGQPIGGRWHLAHDLGGELPSDGTGQAHINRLGALPD